MEEECILGAGRYVWGAGRSGGMKICGCVVIYERGIKIQNILTSQSVHLYFSYIFLHIIYTYVCMYVYVTVLLED